MKSEQDVRESLEYWKEVLKDYENKECFTSMATWTKGKIEAYKDVLDLER